MAKHKLQLHQKVQIIVDYDERLGAAIYHILLIRP